VRSAIGRALLLESSLRGRAGHDERARLRSGTGLPIQRRSLPGPRSAALAVPTRTSAGTRDRDRHGPVVVRSGVRDRVGGDAERIRFSSAILPPYARRSKSLECWSRSSTLKGVSACDFEEALIALLKDAGGLSAHTVGRLKEAWSQEHARWLHVQRL
jgi:hypothetical protein